MTLRRALCYLSLFLTLLPILFVLGLYVLFTYDLLDTIFPDELSDDYPGDPKIFPSIPVLNPFSHRDTLGGDGTVRKGGHKWVYVHGNSSCYSEERGACDTFDSAFTELTHAYMHKEARLHRALSSLDCDAYPPLCSEYMVRPPALIRVASAGPCEFRRGEVEGWDFHCPVNTRTVFLPLHREAVPLNDHFPDADFQLRRFLESDCLWEAAMTQEEIIQEFLLGPDEDDGWLDWAVWKLGQGVGYGIFGVATGWNWLAGKGFDQGQSAYDMLNKLG
ncbi:MAG: hypothetical protein Q9160_001795 [Pyrenula sp. 1 TL-2023]